MGKNKNRNFKEGVIILIIMPQRAEVKITKTLINGDSRRFIITVAL